MSSIADGLCILGVAEHSLSSGSDSTVNGITKSSATDFGKRGITCHAIAPGGVKSDMFTQVTWKYIPGASGTLSAESIENAMADNCPFERCAVPADVVRVVAFLVSDDGGWVKGRQAGSSGDSQPISVSQVRSSPSPENRDNDRWLNSALSPSPSLYHMQEK